MGEYAQYNGESIKIGTCEDMYYLRAAQRFLVMPEVGSLDPRDPKTALVLRFRFPWPDEDHIAPGSFGDYNRSIPICGATVPDGVEHYSIQFTAQAGYLVNLPCPEGPETIDGVKIHRNGFGGAVRLVQQKLLADGRLVPICQCGGCGTAYRVEDQHEIEAMAVALRSRADRDGGSFYHDVADRILAGANIFSELAEGV